MDLKQAYEILEISEDSSMLQVNQAYRDLAQIWHPDHYTNNERLHRKALKKMTELNAARDCIYLYLNTGGETGLNEKESKQASFKEAITVCPKCGIKNRTLSSINRAEAICGRCGSYLFREKQDKQSEDKCERCGKQCATFRGEFHENISYFFERKERAIDAKMCFPCTAKVFGTFTGRTLFGTWWGVIGVFIGPAYILSNIGWFSFNVFRFGFARWQRYEEKPVSEKLKTKVWNQQQNILKFISGHKKEIAYCLVAIGVFLLLLIPPNSVKKVEEVVPPSTITHQQTSVTPTQKMAVPIELEPVNPNRLNTGATPFTGGIWSGHSQINVDNGTDTDAFVRVVRFNDAGQQKIRNFYVRSSDKFVAKQIPSGEYILRVAFGTDWNSDTRKFNYRKSFSKTQTFTIEETKSKEQTNEGEVERTRFSKLSITLHKVLNGNFKSYPIDEDEFWQ